MEGGLEDSFVHGAEQAACRGAEYQLRDAANIKVLLLLLLLVLLLLLLLPLIKTLLSSKDKRKKE